MTPGGQSPSCHSRKINVAQVPLTGTCASISSVVMGDQVEEPVWEQVTSPYSSYSHSSEKSIIMITLATHKLKVGEEDYKRHKCLSSSLVLSHSVKIHGSTHIGSTHIGHNLMLAL